MNEEIKKCVECGQMLKFVPAGISKSTGKPYQAFYACPDRHRQPNKQDQATQLLSDRLDAMGVYLKEEFEKVNHKLQDLLEKF